MNGDFHGTDEITLVVDFADELKDPGGCRLLTVTPLHKTMFVSNLIKHKCMPAEGWRQPAIYTAMDTQIRKTEFLMALLTAV